MELGKLKLLEVFVGTGGETGSIDFTTARVTVDAVAPVSRDPTPRSLR